MPLTVDETVGGATANSFVSIAVADAYIEAIPNSSTWTGDEAKKQAVITATRALSALSWDGQRTTSTQALSWPRFQAVNYDAPFGSATYSAYSASAAVGFYDSTILPQWLVDATCELAREVLKAGTTDIFALPTNDGVIEKTVDVLTTRWADPYAQAKGLARYPRVWNLIKRNVCGMGGPTVPIGRA